ncbi:MAG: Maf family protein [Bacteroidota bacterium]|nr:Maf family protein [Bacteroidota bacterium]MDX5430725.1 Maf family protein [Bacteroidota bacterium]MDX5469472.1 Maf family protein [Bacteroidota bacterium]
MLRDLGLRLRIQTADADEDFPSHLKGHEVPAFLARHKAQHIEVDPEECLITADTVVVVGDEILNKAATAEEALLMLNKLSGKSHWVYTGVCLKYRNRTHVFTEGTEVFFRSLSQEELVFYIETCKPFDKAGAYGIQEWIGHVGVEKIEGCYLNVVGFPVPRFIQEAHSFLGEHQPFFQ